MRSRLTRLQNALDELEHRRMEAEQPERELRATGHVQVGGVWFRPEDFLPRDARAELTGMARRIHELVKTADGTLAKEGAEAELEAIMRRWADLRDQGIAVAQRQIETMRQAHPPSANHFTGDAAGWPSCSPTAVGAAGRRHHGQREHLRC